MKPARRWLRIAFGGVCFFSHSSLLDRTGLICRKGLTSAGQRSLVEDYASTVNDRNCKGHSPRGLRRYRKGVLFGALTGGRKNDCACSSGDEHSNEERCY